MNDEQLRAIEALATVSGMEKDGVAEHLMELGIAALTAAALGKGTTLAQHLQDTEELALLRNAAGRLWAAGVTPSEDYWQT